MPAAQTNTQKPSLFSAGPKHGQPTKEASPKSITINLNGKERETPGSIFYKWAIQTGRIVIVLTELIALGALFYRFVVDRQIADLNDQINKEVLFIRSQEAQENQFRALQDKLTIIKTIKEDNDAKIEIMNKILEAINTGVFSSNSLSVTKNVITLDGQTGSIFSVNNFIEELKQNPNVDEISVDQISSNDAGIIFSLNITLKENMPDDTDTSTPTQ